MAFEQIRIPLSQHGFPIVLNPHIFAAWQKTTDDFSTVDGMAPQNGERITMTPLGKRFDFLGRQGSFNIDFY